MLSSRTFVQDESILFSRRYEVMLVPPKLKQGDTIGVFSPSSPISATVPARYQRGKAY